MRLLHLESEEVTIHTSCLNTQYFLLLFILRYRMIPIYINKYSINKYSITVSKSIFYFLRV